MNEKKGDTTKDSITLVTDKNQPNLRLPDTEIGESLKRLCKNDDIKKALYEATENHKKMNRAWWKQPLLTTTFLLGAWIIYDIIKYLLNSTPTNIN